MSCFVNVIVKGDGSTYKKEYIHYQDQGVLTACNGCKLIASYVEQTLNNLKLDEETDSIKVKIEFDW